ncbi:MAG TPA: cyclase family protein [Burkholderiales bacterium]|nr:cyclase family protein [Burkholderiales bacterium]
MLSRTRNSILAAAAALFIGSAPVCFAQGYAVPSANDVVDLTPTLSTKLKQWWPFGHHAPQVFDYKKHGEYAYTADLLLIDNDTALQLDCPPHMMPPLESGLPNAGYWGSMTCDKAPVWQMMGETVKVDGRSILDKTGAGEIVIFHTGFTDAHFRMPERGRVEAAVAGPVNGETEGWPAATPEVIQHLAKKGVRHVAIDAPRIGSVVEKEAAMTFWAAANEGMVISSYLIGAGQLPPTGAFYVFLNPKIENGHGGPGRAAAILPHK